MPARSKNAGVPPSCGIGILDPHLEQLAALVKMHAAAGAVVQPMLRVLHERLALLAAAGAGAARRARRRCSCRCWLCCRLAEQRCRSGALLLGHQYRLYEGTSRNCCRMLQVRQRNLAGPPLQLPMRKQQHKVKRHVHRMQVPDAVDAAAAVAVHHDLAVVAVARVAFTAGANAGNPYLPRRQIVPPQIDAACVSKGLHFLASLDSCISPQHARNLSSPDKYR